MKHSICIIKLLDIDFCTLTCFLYSINRAISIYILVLINLLYFIYLIHFILNKMSSYRNIRLKILLNNLFNSLFLFLT